MILIIAWHILYYRPVCIFTDPFRGAPNLLVLCETYKPEGHGVLTPLNHIPTEGSSGVTGNNTRYQALQVFNNPKVQEQKPWFANLSSFTSQCNSSVP